jgi:hypothetical protein
MGRAKDIIVKVIPAKVANEFVKKHHYSGKVVANSSLHFGCFLDNKLHGVMSYGSPLDKRKVLPLVHGSLWNEMLELNRMAFDDYLPKYSESRCIAISIKLIKKNAPQIKWILSFSDALQCGDGTIYRASGFNLIQANEYKEFYELPNGEIVLGATLRLSGYTSWLKLFISKKDFDLISNGGSKSRPVMEKIGAKLLKGGYSLKYIYLIDKSCKITVPILPFSKIDELGAGMYRGKRISLEERKQNTICKQGTELNGQLTENLEKESLDKI